MLGINLLHPNVSIYILQTLLYTFPSELTRRICLMINAWVGDHFLYSHDLNKQFRSIIVRRNEKLVTLS